MASCVVVQDVRVHRSMDRDELILKAAQASVKFLRRQAEARRPSDKDEMVKMIWRLYWRARREKMLAAPKTTRRLLREKFGYWKKVGVATTVAA